MLVEGFGEKKILSCLKHSFYHAASKQNSFLPSVNIYDLENNLNQFFLMFFLTHIVFEIKLCCTYFLKFQHNLKMNSAYYTNYFSKNINHVLLFQNFLLSNKKCAFSWNFRRFYTIVAKTYGKILYRYTLLDKSHL